MSNGTADKCGRCKRSVYIAEEVIAAGGKWHKPCFTCVKCNISLDSTTVMAREGEIYCRACYGKDFGPAGYGFGGGAGTLAQEEKGPAFDSTDMPQYGSANKCGRCGKSVYSAEEVTGAGKKWHKSCFACANCNKKLDSTTVSDKDGQIYCKGCYGKEFGPKGFGFGGGAGALTNTGK